MPLLIREDDVRHLVNVEDALAAVEAAFVEQARGTGINQPRRRVRQPHGTLHLMGAALVERGYWGFKAYTTTREGARFIVHLYDLRSGRLLAIIEADRLGQLRTGAASGVATNYLAPEGADVLALFGAGYQAETQLEAIAAVRPLRDVRVFSRTPERRRAFADRMAKRLGIAVRPARSSEEALEGATLITTITTSRRPLFDGSLIQPGVHINGAGSNAAIRAELDAEAVRRATAIFVDDLQQARFECGDLIQAYQRNRLAWERVRPLADVVAGLHPGRQRADDITLFESQGVALWDVALAADVYERALTYRRGTQVSFGDT
ncbi:MAG: ornithine cyclodeaminase family protein [Ardenticatenia bacterium]|nr:ornithine cyclodeaminase family protein [Ardenticatenia bacterium]